MSQKKPEGEILTTEHERWAEFVAKLSGPAGCNVNARGEMLCSHTTKFAEAVLTEMGGFDVPETLSYFEELSGHCDCEILMNIAGE